MNVALYARVSTDAQEARGTIGSQLEALRARASEQSHEIVAEFLDDGHSGARLDRPGLDALRDAAEAGLFDAVWCLSPDRLARAYAYQVIVLDELARHGVRMLFSDAPEIDDDPQARLLTQVQGVIAEYERAKITERYRRGKLYRSRAGEVISWKTPYGYRRVARGPDGPAHLVVFEPEAEVVRRIFDDYVAGGHSTRQIVKRLHDDGVPSPTGKTMWGTSTIGRVLRNEAYIGRVYYNRTELVPAAEPGRRQYRQLPRPKEEWITIAVPTILSEDVFEAAQRVSRDNSKWSPRKATPGAWMLRGLVVCGSCGASTACHQMRGRNAPGIAITTAAITIPCAPAVKPATAQSATSALRSSTHSSSIRSATHCCVPTCSSRVSTRLLSAPRHPTTTCLPRSWSVWSASWRRPTPSVVDWPISIRPV